MSATIQTLLLFPFDMTAVSVALVKLVYRNTAICDSHTFQKFILRKRMGLRHLIFGALPK